MRNAAYRLGGGTQATVDDVETEIFAPSIPHRAGLKMG